MNKLRYSTLLSIIRDLEDHVEAATALASQLSKDGCVHESLSASSTFAQLDARIGACNRISRVIAIKLPELLEVTYE